MWIWDQNWIVKCINHYPTHVSISCKQSNAVLDITEYNLKGSKVVQHANKDLSLSLYMLPYIHDIKLIAKFKG